MKYKNVYIEEQRTSPTLHITYMTVHLTNQVVLALTPTLLGCKHSLFRILGELTYPVSHDAVWSETGGSGNIAVSFVGIPVFL